MACTLQIVPSGFACDPTIHNGPLTHEISLHVSQSSKGSDLLEGIRARGSFDRDRSPKWRPPVGRAADESRP